MTYLIAALVAIILSQAVALAILGYQSGCDLRQARAEKRMAKDLADNLAEQNQELFREMVNARVDHGRSHLRYCDAITPSRN